MKAGAFSSRGKAKSNILGSGDVDLEDVRSRKALFEIRNSVEDAREVSDHILYLVNEMIYRDI